MIRKLFSTTFIVLLFSTTTVFGWGSKGHDIIAHIAQTHLTTKAQKAVTAALDGHKMTYYATWLDNVRNLPEYSATKTWHYANVDEGESYKTMARNPKGDVYTALSEVITTLKSGNANDSVNKLYIKILIHLVGDMHCPMHTGRLTDLGGNRFQIEWFGRKTDLHSIWDENLVEASRKWSYSEWQQNIDIADEKQIAQMAQGTPLDWLNQTVDIGKEIYLHTQQGQNCQYDYIMYGFPIIEQQFLRAGYRLATLLNQIYN